ncbi:sensor histidine kinase KdpD [Ruminococcus sp. OA3]|uniref:sensor histidine kinase n=1 Tax=Ruminococcus sp. OA3 TaxID=2914164 RepID=UPI001F059582|nr:sensor histidine kinase KdpD [Ruminococcus sp. OA3]MCH1981613.1 sensor histidine kinase KdpD [Ruminococcus sp. OA3]
MDDIRANPDLLLKKIEEETQDRNRGHLRIFFGYAAGVGKTYAMLKAAHAEKRRGVDVIVGYVEPHTRPQTMQLLKGLECLQNQEIEHKGIRLKELDLDAAIERKPQLILVDELAHTNAEGCRHLKRYQDVEELLNNGIDVYTTVNVQHIESLNDIVASITGVLVRERIPDHVFDRADQVSLVDIEPEELIERLNEGKIYKEHQARRALGNFFTTENLVALREIALRRTADRINRISDKIKQSQSSDYYTDEHIMVCLSSSPTNARLIRTAARMANAFKGNFTALFVETPDFSRMEGENKERLRKNMKLAQQLGAHIETTYGDNIALQISEFARLSGVSKVVVGRSSARRRSIFGRQSLTEQLITYSPNLDVYIIPDKNTPAYKAAHILKGDGRGNLLPDLLKTLAMLAGATAIGTVFYECGFSEANIITIYILCVLVTSVITSRRIFSLILSVFCVFVFNFFFTVPRFTFQAYDSGYPVTFVVMFIAAFITSSLAVKIKRQAFQAAQSAYRTRILLETNQMLAQAEQVSDIISVTAQQLVKLLKRNLVFYRAEDGTLAKPQVFMADGEQTEKGIYTTDNEQAVAAWVFKNNKHAGAGTNTLGSAVCMYLAVRITDKVYGVVGIAVHNRPLDSFENSVILSILGECALALEKDMAIKDRQEAAALARNEQLRANLLRSISHDLRTPLTSISGNAGILLASEEHLDMGQRRQLYSDIYDDSLWLINLVENLLSVTRIEDGTMHLNLTTELLDEVVTEAMHHINRRSVEHEIIVTQSEDFILVKIDARLIMQVIMNIVDNAVKYTPSGSQIDVRTRREGSWAVIEISDNGDGISDEAKQRIFDMFYTANVKVADSRRSMGLGLALCKSIINAHGGEISVCDNNPKGALFRFTLPAEEVTLHE